MGRARLGAFMGGAAALAVAVLACRQLVGIADDPPQGPIAPSPEAAADAGFTYGQGACATCVTTNCGTEAAACAGMATCAKLETCMSSCNGDATCRAQCGVDHGLGNDTVTPAFEACLATSCAGTNQCNFTCAGLAAVFPPTTPDTCEACIAAGSECASAIRCAQDPTCQAALRCQFSSGTLDVWQACPAVPQDAGAALLTPGMGAPIVGGSCSGRCSWGADWSCLGKVSWPPAAVDPVATTVFVYNYGNGAPIEGATVTLCNTTDFPCTPSLGQDTTGDSGTALLSLKPELSQPDIFVAVSSLAITPALNFIVFPLSQSKVTIPFPTLQAGDLPTLAAAAQVTLDPALGLVIVDAVDCRLAPAPGVTFRINPPGVSTIAYLNGGLPDVGATSTDTSGTAVFANVEAGKTLYITVTAPGGPAGTVPVLARGDGGMSVVYAPPTP